MLEGGQRWLPPPMTAAAAPHQTAAQRGGESKVVGHLKRPCAPTLCHYPPERSR